MSKVSPNAFTISFDIATNQIGTFNTSVTLCFSDDLGNILCFEVEVNVDNPCIPEAKSCCEHSVFTRLSCDRVDEDDAVYIFPFAVHLPLLVAD